MNSDTHSDAVLLVHLGECIERIQEYTGGERATFFGSRLVQDAVVRNLQTLAESTQRLSDSLKVTEPDVPWRAEELGDYSSWEYITVLSPDGEEH